MSAPRAVSARGLAVLVALCAIVLAAAWWLRGGADDASEGEGADPVVGSGVVQQFDTAGRDRPEPFEVELLDGTAFDSTSLTGSVAVYNVWGSWCGPCREEAPTLARVAREYEGEVAFVGVNVRDNDAAARAFERSFDVPYPSVPTGESGEVLLAFGGALASSAVPSTVVLDETGAIAARAVGPVGYRTLIALVEDAGAARTAGRG